MKTRQLVLLLLLGAIGFQTIYYYPRLPPIVASHFNGAGVPNGWSSKGFFFGLYWSVAALLTFAFFVLPGLLARLGPSLLNIPNREYWLAPQRCGRAYKMLAEEMAWFGGATIAFIILTFQMAIRANLPGGTFSSGMMIFLLAIFTIFALSWLIRLYRRFAVPQ